MATYSLDFETASECDISLGAYRYADDPSTKILLFAIARNDEEPLLWDMMDPFSDESLAAESLFREASASGEPIYAFNAQFELAICTFVLERQLGIQPPKVEQWRCTQAMCRRAAAPDSLESAARFFNLEELKNPLGKPLIGVFCKLYQEKKLLHPIEPKTKIPTKSPVLEEAVKWDWKTRVAGNNLTVREAWDVFRTYCVQDVKVERTLHHKIRHFELKGDILDSFQFDMRMNLRGVPVNLKALDHADRIVNAYQDRLCDRMMADCGLRPGQRDKLLVWLKERGYPEDNLQSATVDAILENPPEGMTEEALKVLNTRSLASFAALKKLPVMRDAACHDGRVRGTVQWHAARTGRGGGRIIQPQNFKKSTIGEEGCESHLCYKLVCEEWGMDWIEELWESPLEAIASSIRHFIQPADGMKILDADYAGVEARITPWLAGDENKLKIILQGLDLYKVMATRVFDVPYDKVTKEQRTICKPVELSCCFGVGGRGLRDALARPPYMVERTRKECEQYVKVYRESHPETVTAWHDIEDAAKTVIKNPLLTKTACDGKLTFSSGRAAGIPYLVMRLPSGRGLYYPEPKVTAVKKYYDEEEMADDPWKREKKFYWIDQISFYGKLDSTNSWGRIHTWGSRLFENAVQAIGADLLSHGCVQAEKEGYEIFMIIHDQALAHDNKPIDGFMEALCRKQPWAATFPLEASGGVQPYYLKD